MRCLFVVIALISCKAPEQAPRGGQGDTSGPTCDSAEQSAVFLVRQLGFARSEEGVAWGFDLDNDVSAAGDPDGCGKPDLLDPEGTPGIDNAFAGLLPTLEQTEAAAVSGLLQDSVTAGELLLTIEVLGLDDYESDDCVTVDFGAAIGSPLVGTDGLILPGQSFAREEDEDRVTLEASVEDGRLVFGPVAFELQMQILDAKLDMLMNQGSVRLDMAPDGSGAIGHFGGALSIDYMLTELAKYAVDAELKELLNQVLPVTADIRDEAGACSQLSVAFEYEAVPAFFYVTDL